LFAYVGSALLSKPNAVEVLRGTFVPTFSFDHKFLAIFVAILGTTISPYLFFWQTNQEVEEEIAVGRTTIRSRQGATKAELKYAAWDVNIGMFFSNVVMYFIILFDGSDTFQSRENGHPERHRCRASTPATCGQCGGSTPCDWLNWCGATSGSGSDRVKCLCCRRSSRLETRARSATRPSKGILFINCSVHAGWHGAKFHWLQPDSSTGLDSDDQRLSRPCLAVSHHARFE
jgi:Natural resistance-associated macrophage protein